MYGTHPFYKLDTFELSDAPLTPDADAVLTHVARAILDIFERYPKRDLTLDWRGVRQIPCLLLQPDKRVDSIERVKPAPSPEAIMAQAKRSRVDPKSLPYNRRQFKQRFASR